MKVVLPTEVDFPVVGIGASAGGLDTFIELLALLPADTGMAFVLIQHLDPNHPSLLSEILSRVTKMPVVEVESSTLVRPNHVFVMPANRTMLLTGNNLEVHSRQTAQRIPTTIDQFFYSLSASAKNRAIGIVLSGTGSDGAQGLIDIKANGGITIAQEMATAKFSEMPRNAVATNSVDLQLSIEKMAQELVRISKSPILAIPDAAYENSVEKKGEKKDLLQILKFVRLKTGVDFSSYKQNTITRRVFRRMLLRKQLDLRKYLDYLQSDKNEVDSLFQDMLINVTSFFRDEETFKELSEKVFPEMIKNRGAGSPIRIWVAGCSTGEEVYSIGMKLVDFLEARKVHFPVQIFGTDMSDVSIDKARAGLYQASSVSAISPEYLQKYFTKADNGYQISKTIRDVCIFARQNVISDPPFSALDLVSCRNLLIYLEPELQKRVISLFHYALKPNGFLMLGNAESAGAYADLFGAFGSNQKIYLKKAGLHRPRFDFAPSGKVWAGNKQNIQAEEEHKSRDGALELDRDSDRAVLASRAPAGATINEFFEVVRLRGRTGRFLEAPAGRMTNDILKMTRPGLRAELAKAIHRANRDNLKIRKNRIRIKEGAGYFEADIEVIPFHSGNSKSKYFEVLFFELPAPTSAWRIKKPVEDNRIALLEKELLDTQEYLQSLIDRERLASSDLRAVNEEILSSNEEIQSSNEELETAKEELQSANEELATVNDELNNRNQSLSELNSDLNNLLGTVHVPIIMLTRDLIIRRYSAMADTIINLTPSDVGRSIKDFRPKFNIPNLVEVVNRVINDVSEHTQEIQDEKGRWFSLRIRPYQSLDRKIDGAVIALIDIGTLKNMRDYSEAIVRTIRESLIVLDANFRVISANPYFYKTFSTEPELVEKKIFYELNQGQWNVPEFRNLLEGILPHDTYIQDFEITHFTNKTNQRTYRLNARGLKDGSQKNDFILLAIEDVTERNRAALSLSETAAALAKANLELEQFAFVASHDLQEPLRMVSSFMQLLSKKYHGKIDADADEFISLAVGGAQRMQRLVQDLLHFSQCGKGDLRYETTDSAKILKQTLEFLRSLIEESKAIITFDSLPVIPTDGILLGQVFQNLIANAIKFRRAIPPTVHVSAQQKGRRWEFSVKDNGIGIEKQYAERIFLIFQRLHTKDEYAGTGIGLAMCKKIVERYGGKIWVESKSGVGSTFFFTLPIAREKATLTVV